MERVTITTSTGPREVTAVYRLGHLALTEAVEGGGFVCSHLPTGYAMGRFQRREDGERYVRTLAGDAALDWGFTMDDVQARTERYRRCAEAAGRALRAGG
jgi:hypothetical protein